MPNEDEKIQVTHMAVTTKGGEIMATSDAVQAVLRLAVREWRTVILRHGLSSYHIEPDRIVESIIAPEDIEMAEELSLAKSRIARLENAVKWALGEGDEFPVPDKTTKEEKPYWWRPGLRHRAGM